MPHSLIQVICCSRLYYRSSVRMVRAPKIHQYPLWQLVGRFIAICLEPVLHQNQLLSYTLFIFTIYYYYKSICCRNYLQLSFNLRLHITANEYWVVIEFNGDKTVVVVISYIASRVSVIPIALGGNSELTSYVQLYFTWCKSWKYSLLCSLLLWLTPLDSQDWRLVGSSLIYCSQVEYIVTLLTCLARRLYTLICN